MSRTIRQRRVRQRRVQRRRAQVVLVLGVLFALAIAGGAYGTYDYLKGDDPEWPSIDNLQPQRIGENSIVYSADGKPMGVIQSDENRDIIPYDEMGEWAPKATVAIEDRRFYEHSGVDLQGVARAASVNFEAGNTREGASTLTQQVVRNLYKEITSEKTYPRKAKEATLAMQLEERWSKQKILETYLNLVFYGHNAYGIEAASQIYFSKKAAQLTIPEAALLAGLPQKPSEFDPFAKGNDKGAKARRDDVLRAMHAEQVISSTELEQALATPIQLKAGKAYKTRRLPYFFDYVEQDLIKRFDAPTVRQGGLKIQTTINPKMQKLAEQAIRDTLGTGPVGGAIAVIDTKTGEIRAMASSTRYADDKFNRAAQARRQPGSTAKIWALAAAVRQGIDPDSTTYQSRPIRVRYKGAPDDMWWEPKTYSGSYSGTMSLRSATVASDNAIFAQLGLDLGAKEVAKTAKLLGINQSPLEEVWSIVLGSQVVTPLEQTNFYSTIARGGIRIDPRAVTNVTTPGGTRLELKYRKGRRVLEDWMAWTIVDILEENVQRGTGIAAQISGEDVSGKTGTTDDSKDAWFCGMTPELTACVWIGHTKPTPMYGETGGGRPATIWRRFMEPALQLVKDRPWFDPKGTEQWVPYSPGSWQDDPSLETNVGPSRDYSYYDYSTGGGDDAAADDTVEALPDAGTGGTGGTTTPPADDTGGTDGGTTAPPAGGGDTGGTTAPPTGGGETTTAAPAPAA